MFRSQKMSFGEVPSLDVNQLWILHFLILGCSKKFFKKKVKEKKLISILSANTFQIMYIELGETYFTR